MVYVIWFPQAFKRAPGVEIAEGAVGGMRPRASQDSCASDGDSGVGPDSTGTLSFANRFLFAVGTRLSLNTRQVFPLGLYKIQVSHYKN